MSTTSTTTTTITSLATGGASSPSMIELTTPANTASLVQRRPQLSSSEGSSDLHLTRSVEEGSAGVVDLFQDEEKNHRQRYDVLNWVKVNPKVYRRKPKNIRRFYKEQNDLIDRLQHFYRYQPVPTTNEPSSSGADALGAEEEDAHEPGAVALAIHASFVLNIVLLILKILASIWSGSMSVLASAADSLLDLLSGSVLVFTHRFVNHTKSDSFLRYPQGKSRMEPIGVFSFAIIMMLSSLQIIIEAIRRLVSRPEIELGYSTLAILGFTIFSKAFGSWYCRKVARAYQSGAAEAYADDHRNDVMTNCVGVGAAVAALYVPSLWFLDSTGAIAIAVYIIFCWIQTGSEQIAFLTGRGASPMLLQQLTYIAANHDERIKFVDTVRAYHFGVSYLVEVDIVLPEDMPLRESHDIGESLQHRLEQFKDVERAFVHNDFEWDHSPVEMRGSHIIRK